MWGKKGDLFQIPQKKYSTDKQVVAKMSSTALRDLVSEQEKFISQLVERIGRIREQHYKVLDKADELNEKNQIVQGQVGRMTNQHQELTIKFDMLKMNLDGIILEQEENLKKELLLLKQQRGTEKINSMAGVMGWYRQRATLCSKIQAQNKKLKETVIQLQNDLFDAENKAKESEKDKSFNHLIPQLMQQIQELKQKEAEQHQQANISHGITAMQENIMIALKQQIATNKEEQENLEKISLTTVISELRQQVTALKHQSKVLNNQIAVLSEQASTLNQQKQAIQKQKQKLCGQIVDSRNKISSLEAQLANKQELVQKTGMKQSQLQQEVCLNRQKIAELSKGLEDYRSNLAEKQEKIEAYETSLKDITSNQQLNDEIEVLSEQLDKMKQLLEKKKQQCRQLQAQLSGMNNLLIQKQAQAEKKLQDQISENNSLLAQKEAQTEKFQQQIFDMKNLLAQKQAQTDRQRGLRQQYQQMLSNNNHDQELNKIIKIKAQIQQELTYTQLLLKNKQNQVQKIQQLFKNKQNQAQKTQQLLKNKQFQIQNTQTEYQKQSVKLQSALKELELQQAEYQRSLFQIKQQLKSLSAANNSLIEEKTIIHKNFSDNLKLVQTESEQLKLKLNEIEQRLKNKQAKLKKTQSQLKMAQQQIQRKKTQLENKDALLKEQIELKQASLRNEAEVQLNKVKEQLHIAQKKAKNLQEEKRNFVNQIEVFEKKLQAKQGQLKKTYTTLAQLEKQQGMFDQLIGAKEEASTIRCRKYQSDINQERIKIESLGRKNANLEAKVEENKQSMDKMYQQLIAKDKKTAHMQIKLKEYKCLIQVLKKQKKDIENSYEHKLSNLKSTDTHELIPQPSQLSHEGSESSIDEQKENIKNELISMNEQNKVLLMENEELRESIQKLQEQLQQHSVYIRTLEAKRDQAMRQIQKMGKQKNISPKEIQSAYLCEQHQSRIENILSKDNKGFNPNLQQAKVSQQRTTRQKSQQKQSIEPNQKKIKQESRERKIANKALKGFQILLRLQHQLYKNFLGVFQNQLTQANVKSLQGQINIIIKRSTDMKDVFEDYV